MNVFWTEEEEEAGDLMSFLYNNNLAVEFETHTHRPDFFVLSGHHSCSYSSLTHRAVCLTGSRGGVNRPRVCQKAALPGCTHMDINTSR